MPPSRPATLTPTGALQLKPGRERSLQRLHPWVFSGAIARAINTPQPGTIVDVLNAGGERVARGYYNPKSSITVRIMAWGKTDVTLDFIRDRMARAIRRRASLAADRRTTAYRLIYAESDGLPGLIVDRYGDWLVLQSLTLGMDTLKPQIVDLLMELVGPKGVYERSDVDVRQQEGLPGVTGSLAGADPPESLVVLENGYRFRVDLRSGHKTGFYLDQRENRRKVGRYCGGAEVLNAFSYTGAFAVYAGAHGARQITNLDSSADALRLGDENLRLNDCPCGVENIDADAFRQLRRFRDEARTFDLIILDPPKFAFSRAQIASASRGYKDINLLAMRLLRPGGTLCTFSCSGAIDDALFQKILFGASLDANREVRIIERLSQGPDHPVLLTFPESAYLKGFVCHLD